MKYGNLIKNYLKSSGETIDSFSARCGVSKNTIFRARDDEAGVKFESLQKILACAGYRLEAQIIQAPPATSPAPVSAQPAQ